LRDERVREERTRMRELMYSCGYQQVEWRYRRASTFSGDSLAIPSEKREGKATREINVSEAK